MRPVSCAGLHRAGRGLRQLVAGQHVPAPRRKVYLNGSKSFMTNAVNSKYMLCVARDADDDPEDRSRQPLPLLHVVGAAARRRGQPGSGHPSSRWRRSAGTWAAPEPYMQDELI